MNAPTSSRWLGAALVGLGVAVATAAALGPFVLDVLVYRTSSTTLHQIIGGDAAALLVVAPTCLVVGVLALRGHAAAPILALPPAVFALYTYAQLIVGNEYLRLPGNVEAFFPVLLGIFVTAGAVAVMASRVAPSAELPPLSRSAEKAAAGLLIAIALFVVVGLHARSYVDAVAGHPTSVQYVSSPTPFWLVKLMDLGIVVPAALTVAVGLLRRRAWARKPLYAIVGGYTLLAASVTGMAATMWLTGDPDSSGVTLLAATVLTLALTAFSVRLYRPLLRHPSSTRPRPATRVGALSVRR